MWTLSIWTTVVTALVLLGAYALHRWGLVERYQARRAGIKAWLKAKWDWALAAAIALAPVVWSAALDIVVIVTNLLATVVPTLAGVDLSALMLTDAHKAYIQLGALALPPLRDAIEKLRSK